MASFEFFNATCGRRRSRGCVAAESDHGDGEEKGFGEPEGVSCRSAARPRRRGWLRARKQRQMRPRSRAWERPFSRVSGSGVWSEGFVEAFGYVAKVAGHEGGVVGEAVYAAEAGDLDGGDVGDDAGECHLREAAGEPAEDEDGYDLQCQAEEDGTDAKAGAEVFRGEDSGEEACKGDEVRHDISPVAAKDGDAEEDDVAGHGSGEDVAVVEEDDGVEQATGGGQEHGIGECVRLGGGIEAAAWWMSSTVREYRECGLMRFGC